MELSDRLSAVARLVSAGGTLADVGTDHGYIPIDLIKKQVKSKAVAMDVNQGPLDRANAHIAEQHLEGQIETRLSDGLSELKQGEADSIVIAGMGGALTIRILKMGREKLTPDTELILQPQSEIADVRAYLNEHGFRITAEDMVLEDGKFYPMMRAISGESETYTRVEYLFGKRLLEMRHPVLHTFLQKQIQIREQILRQLKNRTGEEIANRIAELDREIQELNEAVDFYENK